MRRGRQLQELQTSCGPQISSGTVSRDLHGMGSHGQTDASKPYNTKRNAKCRMQWSLDSRAVETSSL